MMRFVKFFSTGLLIISVLLAMSSCGHESPVVSSTTVEGDRYRQHAGGRHLLGLWQFRIDPPNENIEVVPLRNSQIHLNALAFMEPPAGVLLKIKEVIEFKPGEITVDIALTHPFPAAKFAAAFDVCGIVISHGSYFYPLSDKLKFPGEDKVRLLNPDGYTRWWNPIEFPYNAASPEKGYIDGLMGKKNSTAHFDATLNGYKYFASDLSSPDSDLSELDINMRGAFVPGTTAVRRYKIGFTQGKLIFNYAVDANWAPPTGPSPIDIPDDFPESANRPEAYRIEIHNMNNTLEYDDLTGIASGMVVMDIWVFDWFNAGMNTVCAYAQNDELMGLCNSIPVGGDDTYSVYNIELWPMLINSKTNVLVWLEVECEQTGYQGAVPDKRQAYYCQTNIPVN